MKNKNFYLKNQSSNHFLFENDIFLGFFDYLFFIVFLVFFLPHYFFLSSDRDPELDDHDDRDRVKEQVPGKIDQLEHAEQGVKNSLDSGKSHDAFSGSR